MNNSNLFSISISQLLNYYKIGAGIENDLFATSRLREHIQKLNFFNFPCRVDAFIFCVCVKGSINLATNLKEWTLTKNTYAISLPENVIGVNHVSDNFEGYVILFSIDYLKKININLKEILPYYVYVKNYPSIKMTSDKIKRTTQFYKLLYSSLKEERSNRKEEIIKGLVSSMIFKVCKDLDDAGLSNMALKTKSREYYFVRFMESLSQGFREHHNVGYYSEKLSVTPKYLSSIMKNISGLSAAQWIDEYIIMESKTLLRFSSMSIQQISDYLYFPNQSFFSKYFRQHTGTTPTNYRADNN